MNSKLVLTASALQMAALGLVFTFFPDEILPLFCQGEADLLVLVLQVLGALYLGFGLLNWMAKGVVIGGIYARPIAMGNFLHYFAGAMALLKGYAAYDNLPVGWAVAGLYLAFAVLFGTILFRHPLKKSQD